jgi:uncharacterized phage protein gp47/JayE
MPFTTPKFEDIRAAILRDLQNLLPGADIGPDSDFYVRASSVASSVEGLYQHQQWIVRQIFPDTADTEFLELHARLRDINRKAASAATGTITFTGADGSTIPTGTQAQTAGGTLYATTAEGTISSGTATVAAQALVAGSAGNQEAATALTLISAPAGIDGTAAIATMTGGADTETDAALLARLLDILRNPPAGGNAFDYRRWALEVSGVVWAKVYPHRRLIGAVDVAITAAGGVPSSQLIAEVQDYIDARRPAACKNTLVFAPTPLTVDVTVNVTVSGIDLPTATARIEDALEEFFSYIQPGDTVYKSQIEGIISGIVGIVDRAVSAPAANVVPTVDASDVEWPRLGTVTVGAIL